MRLSVKNLGPLREAEVDLSQPLIILTGPNNTGKTWFSWCVYGVHAAREVPAAQDGIIDGDIPDEIFSEEGADLTGLMDRNRARAAALVASKAQLALPSLFASEPAIFDSTEIELLEDFTTSDRIGHSRFRQTEHVWPEHQLLGRNYIVSLALSFKEGRYKAAVRQRLIEEARQSDSAYIDTNQLTPEGQLAAFLGLKLLVFHETFQNLLPPCTIFPAERIAVNIFARELSLRRGELVDEMLDVEGGAQKLFRQVAILNRQARRYPWPIRDSLRIADDLAAISREQSEFADLATDLETSVMGGKIGISKHGDMTFSPTQAPDRTLGIHLTASVVKSLSSLVFYFRYLANAGDFLIIDEPELNLHPDNQRRVARVLAKAVNRGFKIMLSTHSDCLIREFNHLIMLSQDSDVARELRQKFEYEDSSLLTPDKVGVYLFNEDHATPIPVREDGFEVKTIDDEINKMNFVTQTLYVRLFD